MGYAYVAFSRPRHRPAAMHYGLPPGFGLFWLKSGLFGLERFIPNLMSRPRRLLSAMMLVAGQPAYNVLCITETESDKVAHLSHVLPPDWKHPFVGPDDLLVAYSWTHDDFRGKHLASFALQEIVIRTAQPRGSLWYLSRPGHEASLGMARKAGFEETGIVKKSARFSKFRRFNLVRK